MSVSLLPKAMFPLAPEVNAELLLLYMYKRLTSLKVILRPSSGSRDTA
jgi:hypothetical protein